MCYRRLINIAFSAQLSAEDPITRGTTWLIGKQNTDGGFGNSPSTVYDTAVAILALRELNVSTEITNQSARLSSRPAVRKRELEQQRLSDRARSERHL